MAASAPDAELPGAILEAQLARHHRLVVLTACLLAGLRVLLLGAAFPFFANTDEQAHFDVVYKYAYEGVPRGLERFSPGSSRLIVLHGSPEYLWEGAPPPLWTLPDPSSRAHQERALLSQRVNRRNLESTQPPVYYAVAAAWYRLGKFAGLYGGRELYWIRLLDVFVFAGLVWASFGWVRLALPAGSYFRQGVPILLAAFPQNVAYTINNDVLSPLLFGAAFFGLLRIRQLASPSPWLCLATGLAAAGAFLAKLSNAPILALLAVGGASLAHRSRRDGPGWAPRVATLGLACALPIALWVTRNLLVLGDLTGSMAKARALDWSLKPASEILHHPIFSPGGIGAFWNTVMTTYWRGEITWHGEVLAWRPADVFFSLSSAVLVGAAAVRYLRPRSVEEGGARLVGRASLLAFALALLFLVCVSLTFDFGRCLYPSREFPFLASGRLIWGTVAPLLFLCAAGLDAVLSGLRLRRYRMVALLLLAAAATVLEAATSYPVFRSAYNWFHLP